MSISLDEMTPRTDGQATKYTLNLDLKRNFVLSNVLQKLKLTRKSTPVLMAVFSFY